MLASESPALDVIGATFIRELEPGEMVVIDGKEVRSVWPFPFERLNPKLCIFEFVYFARPDTRLYGNEVHGARRRMGQLLATQAPVAADLVMGVPDSGVPAAEGYAVASGIPYGQGLVKNRYIGRTFIAPTQAERANGVRRKLNPLRENIAGKRVVVVDDSIVRGTTTRAMVTMLRESGATEVHLRISSPPFSWPCFYGIDTPDRTELLAADQDPRRDRRVPRRRLARVPHPRAPGDRHRRPGGRLLRRLPDRQLPGAGAGARSAERAGPRAGRPAGPGRDRGRPRAQPDPGRRPLRLRTRQPATYAGAGVDIDAGERAVDLIRPLVASTLRPEVLGGLGGFGGLFALDADRLPPAGAGGRHRRGRHQGAGGPGRRPVRHHRHRPGGHVRGRPGVPGGRAPVLPRLHLVGTVDPDQMAELVAGVAEGCRQVGAALLGRRDGRAPRGDEARASSTWSALPSAWSSATRCSGPPRVRGRRRPHRPALAGPALQRLLPGPPRPAASGPA